MHSLLKPDVTDDILIRTGCALHYAGKYSEAIEKLDAYLASPVKKNKKEVALANRVLNECKSAIEVTKDTLRIEIGNMGVNVNSEADDYSQIFTSDGKTIYFGSRRQLPKSGKRNADTKFDENIFISNSINGSWTSYFSR